MSSYREQYDEELKAIDAAIEAMSSRIDELVPGLTRAQLRSFFKRFSILLGRLDKSGARRPTYLAHTQGNLADHLISDAPNVASAISTSGSDFVIEKLPELVEQQVRLERALGYSSDDLKTLMREVPGDLESALTRSEETVSSLRRLLEDSQNAVREAQEQAGLVSRASAQAETDLRAVQSLRTKLEVLASSDGRRKDSFDNLSRQIRTKADEASALHEQVVSVRDESNQTLAQTRQFEAESKAIVDSLQQAEAKAGEILNLSTQAGLAAAYLEESKALKTRSTVFTYVLYGITAATLAVAAFYVLPGLEAATQQNNSVSSSRALLLTLIRASVLAPLVYAIYFTNKRISALETLRMDYAEKAAASLAYSGYKDEMGADPGLLERLKGSLLLRFTEHPERLLRRKPSQETIQVEGPGFRASSSSASTQRPPERQSDDASAEDDA